MAKKDEKKSKKKTGSAAVVAVILLLLGGLGFGTQFGLGNGGGTGSGTENSSQGSENNSGESEKFDGIIFEISVVENDYFYKNDRITIDDFVKVLEETKDEYIVEVKDDNASLKAYNTLIDKLKELNVSYVEK